MADSADISLRTLIVCYFMSPALMKTIAPTYYGLDRPALEYELPPLPYSFDALEPYIDSETVQNHYLGHHAKYTESMNQALTEWRRSVEDRHSIRVSIIDILRNLTRIPSRYREDIKYSGGGYVNHAIYWAIMSPNPQGDDRWPEGKMAADLKSYFRSFMRFRDIFSDAANKVFGSGYVWLCRNHSNPLDPRQLVIMSTANQDSPLSRGLWPILCLDLWEHAYYLKHRHQRTKHAQEWWYLLDWEQVAILDDWWLGIRKHDEL